MSKENLRMLAVALVGAAAVMAFRTGPDLLQFTGRPNSEQLATIIAAIGAAVSGWLGRSDSGGKGETLDLLQALKRIIEQFQSKGIPDSVEMTLVWGTESYDLKWQKRTKPEPK